jgi:hypothetical protein
VLIRVLVLRDRYCTPHLLSRIGHSPVASRFTLCANLFLSQHHRRHK